MEGVCGSSHAKEGQVSMEGDGGKGPDDVEMKESDEAGVHGRGEQRGEQGCMEDLKGGVLDASCDGELCFCLSLLVCELNFGASPERQISHPGDRTCLLAASGCRAPRTT